MSSLVTQLWQGPGQAAWRDGTGSARGLRLLGWTALLLAAAAGATLVWGQKLGSLLGGLLTLAFFSTAWAKLVGSLLQQNQPALARLVPGHPARLRAGLWLAWSLLAGLVLVLSWWVWGSPLSAGLPWAAWLLVLAWGLRQPWLWALACVPLALWPWLPGEGPGATAWQALVGAGQQQPLFSAALVLLAGLAALAPLLGVGDARHARWYSRWTAQRAAARAGSVRDGADLLHGPAGAGQAEGLSVRLAAHLRRPVRWAMALDLAHALPAGLKPGAQAPVLPRLQLALGPGVQPCVQGVGALLFLAAFVVVAGLFRLAIAVGWLPPADRMAGLGNASFAALGYSLSLLLQMRTAVARTPAERALLSLAPGHRNLPGLPRRLVLRLFLQYQGLCAATFLVVALAIPGTAVLGQALLFWTVAALSGFSLSGSVLSAASQPGSGAGPVASTASQATFVLPAVLAVSLLVAKALGALSLGTWLPIAAVMAVLAGGHAWRQAARQAGLFAPAGRG